MIDSAGSTQRRKDRSLREMFCHVSMWLNNDWIWKDKYDDAIKLKSHGVWTCNLSNQRRLAKNRCNGSK